MNTAGRTVPILPVGESVVLFSDGQVEFGFPKWQHCQIEKLWKQGEGTLSISKKINRNPYEVGLALYEMMLDGKIDDLEIRRKPKRETSLLVPGKEILKQMEGGNEL